VSGISEMDRSDTQSAASGPRTAPGVPLTVGNIAMLTRGPQGARGPVAGTGAEFWPSDSDDLSIPEGPAPPSSGGPEPRRTVRIGAAKAEGIHRFLDQAEAAPPAHEVEEEMWEALRQKEAGKLSKGEPEGPQLFGAGPGTHITKMRHRRHMWIQTDESAATEVQDLRNVVKGLREELVEVRKKVADVQTGVVVEHHRRIEKVRGSGGGAKGGWAQSPRGLPAPSLGAGPGTGHPPRPRLLRDAATVPARPPRRRSRGRRTTCARGTPLSWPRWRSGWSGRRRRSRSGSSTSWPWPRRSSTGSWSGGRARAGRC